MENAKIKLSSLLAGKGIYGEAMEATVDEIIKSIPEATRNDYPEERYAAALAAFDLYEAAQNGGAKAAPNQVVTDATSQAQITSAEMMKIREKAEQSADAIDKSINAKMLALVVNGPMPSEYLDAKKKVVPFSHLTTSQEDIMKKFDAWEAKLAPDDAKGCENNRANFNMVKEAFLKKTALPIYIQSDKKKRAVKGAQIQIPGEGTTDVTMICNKERLLGVVATKLSGVIPTTGDRTLGCRLNWSAPNSKAGQTNSGKPVLKIANRIAALEDDKVILLNKVKTVAGKVVTEKNAKAVRVDVAFKVIGKQRPNSTTPTYTTVRVSGGYSDYPVFERASAEMIKEFGDLHSDPNVINIPTGQDLAKQIENIQNTYAYFVRSGNALKFGVRDAVREIQTAVAPAKNDDLDM